MRRLTAMIVWGAVLFGVVGAVVALRSRGSEEVFEYKQSSSLTLKPVTALSAAHVAAVVVQAPEPVPAAERTRPVHVSCHPGGGGTLRNPWSCTILYRSGTRAYYRVLVEPDGHYTGTGSGIITGCCVDAPTLLTASQTSVSHFEVAYARPHASLPSYVTDAAHQVS